MKPENAAALRERRAFTEGKLSGTPVTPHNETDRYKHAARGSAGRLLGFAAVPGAGGLLPGLGLLDPAPAMFHALGEADYIVTSFETPVAWHLGPEVAGVSDPAGKWIQTVEFGHEYGWFSPTTTRHQKAVHAALSAARQKEGSAR